MENLKQHFDLVGNLKQHFVPPLTTPVTAVIGAFNTGKSTLINNLLAQQITPVGVIPTTSTCLWFSYDEKWQANIFYRQQPVKTAAKLELTHLLTPTTSKKQDIQRVEIKMHHPLLQITGIIDTPGIDSDNITATQNLALIEQIKPARHVAYLLHQRGISETDRRFIENLMRVKNSNQLSFWINRNLGAWDGSSLAASKQMLREICAGQVDVFTIDTKNPTDVEKFRYFIQDQAARALLIQAKHKLTELDRQIPPILDKAVKTEKDGDFLIDFGDAYALTHQILGNQKLVQALPPVSQRIKSLLASSDIKDATFKSATLIYKTPNTTPDPAVIKSKIATLLQAVLQNKLLSAHPHQLTGWQKIKRQLDEEQYLITAVGGFSSGKTTFLNALLGEPLLPAESKPTTFAITHLKAGTAKTAIISFARAVIIPTHRLENNRAVVCRHELAALEHWLIDTDLRRQIIKLEKSKNGRLEQIKPQQLLNELSQLKTNLASIKRERLAGKNYWPAVLKKLSPHQFDRSSAAQFYKVYFTGQSQKQFDLNTHQGRNTLATLVGSPLALPVDTITIQHPAKVLRLATFVDTPGLDAVYQKHDAITREYLPQSDCFLWFLNGKHILTKPDLELGHDLLKITDTKNKLNQKLFIVVNFADALTLAEQEKVRLDLIRHMIKPAGGQIPMERIYFISSWQALSGQYSGEFSRLNRHLRNHIWHTRCQKNYCRYLDQCAAILKSLPNYSNIGSSQLHLLITDYLNTITGLKQMILPTGGVTDGAGQNVR